MTETQPAPRSPGAEFLASSLLGERGFRNAFFLRTGGVSKGPYESLNFSVGVGDERAHVEENLRRAETALGLHPEHLCFLSQVHGVEVVELPPTARRSETILWQGDAVVAGSSEIGCAVRTADCVPILVGDQRTGRACAIHAGWRGLVAGVVNQALAALGGQPHDYCAAIGPHISWRAFEVGEDVAERLRRCSTAPAPVRTEVGKKPHVDLRQISRAQLMECGVPAPQIDDVLGCTYQEPARFFSYRRDGRVGGRHLSAIVPRRAKS